MNGSKLVHHLAVLIQLKRFVVNVRHSILRDDLWLRCLFSVRQFTCYSRDVDCIVFIFGGVRCEIIEEQSGGMLEKVFTKPCSFLGFQRRCHGHVSFSPHAVQKHTPYAPSLERAGHGQFCKHWVMPDLKTLILKCVGRVCVCANVRDRQLSDSAKRHCRQVALVCSASV